MLIKFNSQDFDGIEKEYETLKANYPHHKIDVGVIGNDYGVTYYYVIR